jgi:hypothetical protein
MRYLIQLLVPALMFVGVVYLLTRQRRRGGVGSGDTGETGSDTAAFVVILALGAVVALGAAWLLQSVLA